MNRPTQRRSILLILALSFAATASAVQAEPKTRAEVRADLRLWTRAGLADLHRGELEPDIFGLDYRTRYADYVRMRTGPEYQQALELERGLSNSSR